MQPYNFLASEKHKKYLIEAIVDGNYFYTVQRMDDGADRILLDKANRVLLFQSIESLSKYIYNDCNEAEKSAYLSWLNELRQPVEPYATLNFDTILSLRNNDKKETLENAVSVLGFIEDYAYQTEDDDLLKALSGSDITNLRDYFMDLYIWNVSSFDSPEEARANLRRSVMLISQYFRQIELVRI